MKVVDGVVDVGWHWPEEGPETHITINMKEDIRKRQLEEIHEFVDFLTALRCSDIPSDLRASLKKYMELDSSEEIRMYLAQGYEGRSMEAKVMDTGTLRAALRAFWERRKTGVAPPLQRPEDPPISGLEEQLWRAHIQEFLSFDQMSRDSNLPDSWRSGVDEYMASETCKVIRSHLQSRGYRSA